MGCNAGINGSNMFNKYSQRLNRLSCWIATIFLKGQLRHLRGLWPSGHSQRSLRFYIRYSPFVIRHCFMCNSAYRTNGFAVHTGNIARLVDSNGVEGTGKPLWLRANGYTGTAFDAGVPINSKQYSRFVHTKSFYTPNLD